ncbi:hypothetical protein [Rhizobium rhizogenes]|uniref:hypothetical protein n=1 Tax=Rhizobium rhizogenes TaxID=359 RepID=UPI001572CD80|nr:hypothetical protein [Rhizobium rhizogenes]NTF59460.1 hypothetical protein [Rhizobium rhizogenes]NTF79045.1 hypothetical protein [Rhizobium rhizogenes]NTF95692.1 hypothetical protein [Rhizobium rhizogenes]
MQCPGLVVGDINTNGYSNVVFFSNSIGSRAFGQPSGKAMVTSWADAQRRLASYQPRVGEGFALAVELELKLQQLTEVEKDLAATGELEDAIDRAAA